MKVLANCLGYYLAVSPPLLLACWEVCDVLPPWLLAVAWLLHGVGVLAFGVCVYVEGQRDWERVESSLRRLRGGDE